jgi:hypothetical protein
MDQRQGYSQQGYKYWQAIPDMAHKHSWWHLWIRANHNVLKVYPKSEYWELFHDDEIFILDSWLWDTVEDYDDWKKRWPGGA